MAYVSRTKVSLKLLQHLVSNIETVNNSSNNNNNGAGMIQDLEMIQELDKAIHDGFLVRDGTGATQYGFSHDRIKEAAFILIPEGTERDGLRRKLGMLLYSVSQDLALGQDWMTIAAADHMNAATKTVKDEEEAIFLTKLNFEAGERCVWVAAFDSASKYLEQATAHLQNNTQQGDPWTFHYSLTLEVFSLRADAELAKGNWDVGFKVSEEVLDRGRTIEDKLSTQLSYSKALGRQKSHEESFLSSSGTLQAMGLYPKTPIGMKVGLVRDLMYVRRFVKAKTDEEILTMAPSTDVQLGLAIELFGCAIRQCVYTNRLMDLAALVFKALFLCFHHGQFPQTGRMFLAYAFICDKTGDYGGARRFADLAVAMAAQSPERGLYGWVLYCRTAIFDTWSKSQKEIAELLDVAFKRCMAGGDYESAIIGRSCALECDFLAGTSLVLLDIRCADLVKHSQMYAEVLARPVETIWLPVRHLRGTIDSPLDFDALAAFDEGDEDKAFLTICITSYLAIGVYWSNYGFAEKVLLKAFPPADKSFTRKVPRLFFSNIAYNTLYRTNGNRAYRKRGKEAASELRKLSEERGMNSWHRVIIGDAHIKGCTRKKTPGAKDVLAEYDRGIDAALKCHHKHDAALASQLAAEYLTWKMEGGSLDDAHSTSITKYLSDARGWYREWGAINLVRHLEETFSGYLRRDR
ncbi:expressed unknown protein [Seminavis robusta]|uniref:Uncharacterized protein n=1 Tax=Seminavis robusta TaxID=568900 RepID=A0A9N8EZG3_9STRA|nr:expressed unknown protein [Seminavis robusta]|eukprot:Sro2585_g331920.2  (691) ;mRNA; r:11220-13292